MIISDSDNALEVSEVTEPKNESSAAHIILSSLTPAEDKNKSEKVGGKATKRGQT